LINFDYSGIDSVTFTSGEEQFAMDNLTVSVPEPKSLNLILLIIPFAVMNRLRRRPNKSRGCVKTPGSGKISLVFDL